LFFGSGAAATLQQQADQLLAGALMDARGVAVYGAAKYFFRAYNLVAQAIAQVTMPVASRLHAAGRREDLRVLFEKAVCFLYLSFIPLSLALLICARPLFGFLFQGRYDESVPAFRVLVISGLTLPLASVGSPFLTGLGEVRALLWISWTGFLVGLGLAWAWIPRWGPVGAASALLVAAVVGMLARAWVLRPLLGFSFWGIASRTRDAAEFFRRRLGSP
jgi:O-antigen/teichoic acid export membrane protein